VNMEVFNRTGRELMLSIAVHILVLGAVVVFGHNLGRSGDAVVVYLTDEAPGGSPGPQLKPAGSPGAARPGPVKKKTAVSARSIKKDDSPPAQTAPTWDNEREPGPSGPANTAGASVRSGTDGTGSGPGSGGAGHGGGTGRGSGSGTGTAHMNTRYLREHFAYIRDAVMRHLVYPAVAKRNGWSGRVTVSFIIRENGLVEKARVIKSSGYDILDSNAIKTIMDVQPFPKPPVKAELVLPIVYKLD